MCVQTRSSQRMFGGAEDNEEDRGGLGLGMLSVSAKSGKSEELYE
jgi:hypothetical protein